MSKKLPYIPLFTGDWRKDPALTLCTPATRGVWIDLLCAMHDLDRSGELRGTLDEIARLARCSTVDAAQALTDLQNKRAAEITERNGEYIVRNRRMYRESERRKSNADRQERHRQLCRHGPSNGVITPEKQPCAEYESDAAFLLFEEFWEAYPKGRKKSKARAREAFRRALRKIDAEVIIAATREYAVSDEGLGAYVKMPETWLNGECWSDDREAWNQRNLKAQKPLEL